MDYKVTDTELTSIANAIRTKGGTSAPLEFPTDFVDAIGDISGGGIIQSLSVTQNGTYTPPSGVDGYAPVTVNVSGGGGTNIITVSPNAPTSSEGNTNDLWVRKFADVEVSVLEAQTLTRKYTINITKAARDTNYTFGFYGARELDFIFDDGNGNEVLLQDIDGSFTYSGSLDKTKLFDKSLSQYTEASGLPATMVVSLTVPAGYSFKRFRVAHRNESSYKDFWRTFTVKETFVYNGIDYSRTVLSETDMVYSQWNVGNYVDFTDDMVFPTYAKADGLQRYIKRPNQWETISSLDAYINYI